MRPAPRTGAVRLVIKGARRPNEVGPGPTSQRDSLTATARPQIPPPGRLLEAVAQLNPTLARLRLPRRDSLDVYDLSRTNGFDPCEASGHKL